MVLELSPGRTSSISAASKEVLSRIALNTISSQSGLPAPTELSTLLNMTCVSRQFHEALSITNNYDLYSKIFRLMFDVDALQRRLGVMSTVTRLLTLELQARIKLLRRIKLCSTQHSENTSTLEDNLTVADDHRSVLFMILENEYKNMQQLQYAGVGLWLDALITRALENRTSEKDEPSFGLVLPLVWMTGSPELLVQGNSRRREEILDFLDEIVRQEHQGTHSPRVPGSYVEYFGIRLKFTPPNPISFARLLSFNLFHAAKPPRETHGTETNVSGHGLDSVCMTAETQSRRYDDDWSHFTTINSLTPKRSTWPTYSVGALSGFLQGSLFIPVSVLGDLGGSRYETYEVPMQCHLREYYALTEEDSVSWDVSEDDANGISRAWFSTGTKWYETEDALMIYDPKKLRWTPYQLYDKYIDEAPDVFDTIILGTSSPKNGKEDQYSLHGRVRPHDGFIALVRKPTDHSLDFLGTWVFHGHMHGGKDVVGDWRSTASVQCSSGSHGWFKWSKDLL